MKIKKVIAVLYLIVGIAGSIAMSMLLLAQYEVVENCYSIANKDAGAKLLGWILLFANILFIVVAVDALIKRSK